MLIKWGVMAFLLGLFLAGCATAQKTVKPACNEKQVSCQEKVKINPW